MPANLPELPLPEDTEAMIAKAKEMVEAAVKGQAEANANTSKKLKRKVEEVDAESEDEEAAVVVSKRAKVEVVELKKERVKTRTLLGISATLVIGYVACVCEAIFTNRFVGLLCNMSSTLSDISEYGSQFSYLHNSLIPLLYLWL